METEMNEKGREGGERREVINAKKEQPLIECVVLFIITVEHVILIFFLAI
tara:strand:- start:99 stop:248 length:150 start_codon:yes stop_codon:yes gene_type:complete